MKQVSRWGLLGLLVGGLAWADGGGQKQQTSSQQQAFGGSGSADGSSLVERSRDAFGAIVAAQQSIEAKDMKNAKIHLSTARSVLDKLYGELPGKQVMSELSQAEASLRSGGTGVDFAPLLGELRQAAVYMDPEFVAGVEKAQQQSQKGHTEQAAESLRLARQRLVIDVAALPVESAYARVVAADTLLTEGNTEDAKRLLSGLPVAFTEIQLAAPMVPVRFNLRAAAEAAESKDWKKAEGLLDSATAQLEQIQQGAQGDYAKDLEPIIDRASRLQKQADGGKPVKAQELRNLAKRTTSLDVG